MTIEFQLSIVLFVALLGYMIGTRFSRSVVVGAILVGLVMGPSVLGTITYTPLVETLAHIGAVFLLFVVGLECNFKEIYNARSALIAAGGVILPFVAGGWLAIYFGYALQEAFFIAVALTATSIAITAQVLNELGKLDTAVAKAIIGAAVIDDVLGLLALSTLKQFASGQVALGPLGIVIVVAFVFIVGGVLVGTRVAAPFLARFDAWANKHGRPNLTFFAAVTFAFFYSAVAELVGLSAVVGAFLAGVSLASLKIRSFRDGAAYFEVIFAAIFFLSLGILLDFHAFGLSIAFVIFLAALTVLAIASKVVGCMLPAYALGLNGKESLAVGIGMVPRGEI
ncbi:MAG: cation:proton antiporter, partial [Candidatus Micrarchaeota archaeon]